MEAYSVLPVVPVVLEEEGQQLQDLFQVVAGTHHQLLQVKVTMEAEVLEVLAQIISPQVVAVELVL